MQKILVCSLFLLTIILKAVCYLFLIRQNLVKSNSFLLFRKGSAFSINAENFDRNAESNISETVADVVGANILVEQQADEEDAFHNDDIVDVEEGSVISSGSTSATPSKDLFLTFS